MIPAHDSPLAALAFSPNGTKVATASEKGTVIRVFHVSLIIHMALIICSVPKFRCIAEGSLYL